MAKVSQQTIKRSETSCGAIQQLGIPVLVFTLCVCGVKAEQSFGQEKFVIPEERLMALDPDLPQGYRDLAEELSVVKTSPLARNLTIRLYLICAANSNGKIRRSALRGLIHSARTKKETQRFKALAFLQDNQFSGLLYENPTVKKTSSRASSTDAKSNPQAAASDPTNEKIMDALRSLRQGKNRRAKKVMEGESVRTRFAKFDKLIAVDEFLLACESGEVTDSLLLRILQMEDKIRSGESAESILSEESDVAWRYIFKNSIPPRVPKIEFDSITEFDPRKSVYRNGIWRVPADN